MMNLPEIKVKDFLKQCGEKTETKIMFYECDDREEITLTVEEALDEKWHQMLDADIASWDIEDGILCIYYFRAE